MQCHTLRRLMAESSGASLVETAILVPTILMLMAGAADLALGFWLKMQTQQAAARAIEMAYAGGLERLSPDDLRSEAASAANVARDNVAVARWLECNGTVQASFEGSCNSGETVGRYVSVRISNAYQPMLAPLLPEGMTKDGAISFEGFSSLRLQ